MDTFYTRTGDDGTTGLLGKGRVQKHDLRMETIGSVDEVTAVLGLARSSSKHEKIRTDIQKIQINLYQLMGELAATKETAAQFKAIGPEYIDRLEELIAEYSQLTEIPKEFIVPGDSIGGAALSMARTVVRRAERRVSELLSRGDVSNNDILRFLNRLSSLFFVMELLENQTSSGKDQTLVK